MLDPDPAWAALRYCPPYPIPPLGRVFAGIRLNIIEHIDDLDKAHPGSALDFIAALEKAFLLLSERPEIGAKRNFNNPRPGEVRLWPITDFRPYLIFYRIETDTVRILRYAFRPLVSATTAVRSERGDGQTLLAFSTDIDSNGEPVTVIYPIAQAERLLAYSGAAIHEQGERACGPVSIPATTLLATRYAQASSPPPRSRATQVGRSASRAAPRTLI